MLDEKCAVCGQANQFHHEGERSDACECGDYRHQHEGGEGRCLMRNDLTHGFRPCLAFRLSRAHHEFVAPSEALCAHRFVDFPQYKALGTPPRKVCGLAASAGIHVYARSHPGLWSHDFEATSGAEEVSGA